MSNVAGRIVIPRTWRSEWLSLLIAVFLSIVSIFLSKVLPWSVVKGDLITFFGYEYFLHLPLFWFIPAIAFSNAMYRVYNVRYSVHSRGVECEIGILALKRRVTRLWYEDIRAIQVSQTIIERFLGIGTLEVGTAATGLTEVMFKGIAAPEEVQEMLQRERDLVSKNTKK